jgi:hypothetical protein
MDPFQLGSRFRGCDSPFEIFEGECGRFGDEDIPHRFYWGIAEDNIVEFGEHICRTPNHPNLEIFTDEILMFEGHTPVTVLLS